MVGFVDGEKDVKWWRDEVIKECMLEQRGNVMEPRPPGVQVNGWTSEAPIWHVKDVKGEREGRKVEQGRKMAQQTEKMFFVWHQIEWSVLGTGQLACVCVFVGSHHSLWVGGVLLGLWIWWTAHQWAASIWRVWWKEVSGGSWGLVVTDREMEDSIRHAISQRGTPVWRDRLGPFISLHYP